MRARLRWIWIGFRVILAFPVMLLTGLVILPIMAPCMLIFAFLTIARVILGFVIGIVSPSLGRRILPDDDFDRWLDIPESFLDRLLAPMEKLLDF